MEKLKHVGKGGVAEMQDIVTYHLLGRLVVLTEI